LTPLTAGQRADRLLDVPQVDAHVMEGLAGDLLALLTVQPLERPDPDRRLRAEEEVPPHAHQRNDGQILVDGRDAGVECLAWRAEPHEFAVHQELAGVMLVHAGEDLDQR
jgi:hypothetical protein